MKVRKFNEEWFAGNPIENGSEELISKLKQLSSLISDKELRNFILNKAVEAHNAEYGDRDDMKDTENCYIDIRDLFVDGNKVTVTLVDDYENDYYVTFKI